MNRPPDPDKVRCPKCGRKQTKRPGTDAIYYCTVCHVQFDNDPDEGGDYSQYDPAWRLEKQKRRRSRT